jgi:exonuclease VII small subunit
MSNSTATANVIPMRDFDRPAQSQQAAQFERLLRECQDLALGRLEKSVSAMLDKVEDALWGLANNAHDRDARDLYLKAKDTALAQRKTLEEQFRSRYLSEFQSRTERTGKPREEFSQYDVSSLELNLVAEDDLDETLKANEMAAKLRRYCEEELVALDQRIGVVIGDATLQGEANPFSPQAICSAFRQACQHVEPNQKIRMVFHKLFDDHVLDDIRSIYKDLNALLVQRSILPRIRYGMQRGGIGRRGRLPLPAAPGADAMAAAPGLDAYATPLGEGMPGGGEQDFFAVLQNLMGLGAGMQRAGLTGVRVGAPPAPALDGSGLHIPGFPPILGGGAAATAAGARALLQGAELVGSLTRIQHGDVSSIAAGNLPLAATLVEPGTTNVLRELKGTAFGTGLGYLDSMTLDIVTLLFDQIFDDSKIPSAMKGLIGRLQIPMLKVAILDKTFFSKKTHPARKLLDALGEVALGLPADFGTGSPLYARLENINQRLIDGFQDSIDIFDALRTELEQLLAEENHRAEEESRATAQRIEQKEKLAVAKAVAQQEIMRRAKSNRIPTAVLKFLAGQWVKLLLIAHAKHGADSDAFQSALATMDLLIWSVTPMQSLEERRQLAARLPGLLKRINVGMQLVGTDEAARRTFFSKLMRCHTKVINGPATEKSKVARSPVPAQAAAPGPAPASTQSGASAAEPPVLTDEMAPSLDFSTGMPAEPPGNAPSALLSRAPAATEADADTEPAEAPPEFCAVTVINPFGDGEIEVEEIDLRDIPGAAATTPAHSDGGGDEHSRMAGSLREGAWVEFRDDEDVRRPARLSYISPLKGTYLFVSRQGKKVGEYSLYQLGREFRTGRAVLLDEVPLFDRAMTSLVGVLKGAGKIQ